MLAPLTAAIAVALAATADCSGVTAATVAQVVTPRGLVPVVATAVWAAEAAHWPATVAPAVTVEMALMGLTE